MTQYMFSVIHGELDYSPEEMQSIVADVDAFNAKYAEQTVFAGGLEEPSSATMIDGTGSEVVVTDGPFAETKEQLGGFWILELPDLDTALKVGAEASKACALALEIRPFQAEPPA
ncbi:MAG TPA: YciI family protein [Aeromicrobium sp.]|nr:YciI family protein [Aeromicrobium sp.]